MSSHPFENLTPDFIIDAIEHHGLICDGRLLALNSYENRVYQVGIEDESPIIAKFYRPDRWNPQQIEEEHRFSFELDEQELPVVAPIKFNDRSILQFGEFDIALFRRFGGHSPELDYGENLSVIGRLLARMHLIGERKPYQHRPSIDLDGFGADSVHFIRENFIPVELSQAYQTLTDDLLATLQRRIEEYGPLNQLRVHGDCHAGNLIIRDDQLWFVDLDDSRMAPAIQDIWMLLSGDTEQQARQLRTIIDAYRQFRPFDLRELHLIEVYRSLRIIHYCAWLARRWDDPAFPHNFPWFNTTRYWEQHILELREQLGALQHPPINID